MVKKNLKDQLININKKLKCKNITRIKEIEQIKMTLKADLEKQKIESKKNRDKYNDFLEEEEYLFQEGYEKVLNAISNEDYIEIEGMHNTVFDKYNCGLWYFNKFSNLIGLKKIESPKIYQIDTDVYSSVKEGYNASEKISIKKDVVKEVFNKIGLYKEKKSSSSYYMEIKPNNKFNTLNIYNRNGWEIPNGRFILDYFIKKYIKKDSYFISFNSEDNLSTYTFKNIPTYYNDICIRYRYKNKLTSGCVSDYDFDEKKNQKEFFLILYNDFNLHPDEVEKHRKIVKKSPMSASKKIFYFFQEHNLVPNFIDDEATEWYKRLNNRKKIFEEIYEKEYKPNKILPSNDNHTDAIARKDEDYKFNYQNLLENYDLERIEDNLVEYYISIKSWTEELLNKINDLEKDNEETLIEINKFRKKAISLEERKDNNAFKERGFILFTLMLVILFVMSMTISVSATKIGVSLPTQSTERWVRDKEAMEDLGEKKDDIDVKVQNANQDAEKQLSQCTNLMTQGIDVLILAPYDATSAASIVENAQSNDVPVISYDRLIIDTSSLDAFVAFDSVKVGELQGKYITDVAPKGKYVVLSGAATDYNAKLFKKGAMKHIQPLADKGEIDIVMDQSVENWDPSNALKLMENALTDNDNNIDAVLAPNDQTAGAAIEALASQKLDGEVPITGQDATESGAQRIVEGTQSMTILKDTRKLAKEAIEVARLLGEGEDLS
ncbi:MAG: sugar ABC transporter substrate-binding protein, partial [Candidatus Woesearchaeota archaeon]